MKVKSCASCGWKGICGLIYLIKDDDHRFKMCQENKKRIKPWFSFNLKGDIYEREDFRFV